MDAKAIKILLVEDDDVDALSIARGFAKEKIANEIVRVRDGLEALELLQGRHSSVSLKRPFVVFLDLNLPRMSGFELLRAIRGDPLLSNMVVFVLTTSNREEDRLRAYQLSATGYIHKGNAGRDFINLVYMIDHFWRVVELP